MNRISSSHSIYVLVRFEDANFNLDTNNMIDIPPSRDEGQPPYTTQPITLTWLLRPLTASQFY